jgi:transcriptional regulator with XRE-family HTH domain
MRVYFPKEKQKKFINKVLLEISVKEVAKICNLSERTIRDWRRGKFLIDLNALRKMRKKTGIEFPSNVELRNDYWYVAKGSSKGGIAVFKKYGRVPGDPEYRKKKWYEW